MMLKIVTDPTAGWPLEAADLRTPSEHLALIPKVQLVSQDLRFRRPDGGLNVIQKKRRSAYSLEVDWIDFDTYERILRILERRVPVYLFPNFDEATVFSMPLQGSMRYWHRNNSTQLLEKLDYSFLRSGTVYYQDRAGRFQSAVDNVARYQKGALGVGLCQETAWSNDADIHPLSAALLWSPTTTPPASSPVWDAEVLSPYAGFLGSARLPYTNHASLLPSWSQSFTAGSTSAGLTHLVGVWLMGDAEVDLQLILNSFDQGITSNVKLSPHRWTPVYARTPKVSTGNSVQIIVRLSNPPDNDGAIYAGPQFLKIGTTSDAFDAPMWTPTSVAIEKVQPYCQIKGDSLSVSWTGRIPQLYYPGAVATNSQCWRLMPDGDMRAEWGDVSGNQALRVWLNSGETLPIDLGSAHAHQGKFYAASFVLDTAKADPTARLVLQIEGESPLVAKQTGRADFVTDARDENDIIIGSWGASPDRPAAQNVLAHVRVDQRAWSEAEQDLQTRIYIEDGFRQILAATAGRRFYLSDVDLNPKEDAWNQIKGSMTLEELDQDPLLVIAPE